MTSTPCVPGCACGKHSPESRAKKRAWAASAARRVETAPNWRGDHAGYDAVHFRLRDQVGPARRFACARRCGSAAAEWVYLGGAPDERRDAKGRPFTTDLSYYEPWCRSCHRAYDHRDAPRRSA